jgi:hypothetical protein
MTAAELERIIAAAVTLSWRQRDAIRQAAIKHGCLVVDENGDEFAALPASDGKKYPLSSVAVIGHAREFLELIGHVVDPKTIAETWLALGNGHIDVDERLVDWLDQKAAETYTRTES